jgi:hypothetical protein
VDCPGRRRDRGPWRRADDDREGVRALLALSA